MIEPLLQQHIKQYNSVMSEAPRDGNRVPSLIGKSDADNSTVVIEADPTTKRLKVNSTITGGVARDSTSTSTDVSLASSASSAQLLAANSSRKGLMLTNTDTNTAYLYYGTTATASKFSAIIPGSAYWEMPEPVYTGRIDTVWVADGSGSLIGSEL